MEPGFSMPVTPDDEKETLLGGGPPKASATML